MQWIMNGMRLQGEVGVARVMMGESTVSSAVGFHKGVPGYRPTSLHHLKGLARHIGVADIMVKDESERFGLNAFKVLGGAYAMARHLGEVAGIKEEDLTFKLLQSDDIREKVGTITFYTATDGNHGHGVAWAARVLGHKAVVYMPKGSAASRLERIRNEGAEASITDLNYDDAVRLASAHAEENGGILVQDTAFAGYEKIPLWIMQGYGVIMREILDELADGESGGNEGNGERLPTHVFLQAGVGSFAGAMTGCLADVLGKDRPRVVIVEPEEADCLFRSAKAGDGRPRAVGGDMATIMAGLACGEPNIQSWEILRDHGDFFVSCEDHVAALGMRVLSSPMADDPRIVSGESGAVGMGLLMNLRRRADYSSLAVTLGIGANSRILIISTEGDTDPENYRKVVWDCECSDGK